MIALVVAMARNGVIGRDNGLPWGRLPEDLKHFKAVTLGKPVLMGRKTYESIGKPLPGRTNFVLTRDRGWKAEGVVAVHSLAEALTGDYVSGIGGAEIYRLLLPVANRIYLTLVHGTPAGDVRFDMPDATTWRETAREPMLQGANDQYPADFLVLDRKG